MDCNNQTEVLSVRDAISYLEGHSKKFEDDEYQLRSNSCYVYYIDDEVVIIPGDLNDNSKALKIFSKDCFKKFLEDDYFPIEETIKDIHQEYQSLYQEYDFLKTLNEILQEIGLPKIDSLNELDEQSLHTVIELQKSRLNTNDKASIIRATMILGELLIRKHNGCWIYLKRYGQYNPYYLPAVQYENGKILLLFDFSISYWEGKDLELKYFLNQDWIKSPGLMLNTPVFNSWFKGFYFYNSVK